MTNFIAYYKKNDVNFEELPKEIPAAYFFSNFTPVEVLKAESLDDVYYKMQGDVWSPNGEQREFIRVLKLNHTSMSVGDVIYSQKDNKFYCVDNIGFSELVLTNSQ